jgi:hypothetical protein
VDWFRLDSDVLRHPRVLKLMRLLKLSPAQAVGHLTCLFCGIAEHAEDGSLVHVEDEDIEIWAEWIDRDGRFANALIEVGIIETEPRHLHGWWERHEQMFKERERKARERLADQKRKAADRKEKHRNPVRKVSAGQTPDGPENVRPSPPDENRTPLGRSAPPRGDSPNRTGPDRTGPDHPQYPGVVVGLHAIFCESTGRSPERYRLDDKKAGQFAELVAWAGSTEAAERGIRKVGASAHHRGHNSAGKRYDTLDDKPFRTAEAFRGWCEDPVGAPAPPRALSARQAAIDRETASVDWDAIERKTSEVKP